MDIKECSFDDIQLLSNLNQMLIEDEKAEVKLNIMQLEKRMTDFMDSGYKAFLFYENDEIIGYALCNMDGYGKQAFQTLLTYLNMVKTNHLWINISCDTWREL